MKGSWKIDGLTKSLKSDAETAKEVAALVDVMRNGVSSERKAARDKLVKLGVPALLELKKFEKDKNVEIRESVKDVIRKIE